MVKMFGSIASHFSTLSLSLGWMNSQRRGWYCSCSRNVLLYCKPTSLSTRLAMELPLKVSLSSGGQSILLQCKPLWCSKMPPSTAAKNLLFTCSLQHTRLSKCLEETWWQWFYSSQALFSASKSHHSPGSQGWAILQRVDTQWQQWQHGWVEIKEGQDSGNEPFQCRSGQGFCFWVKNGTNFARLKHL